jgi:UDP-N-acetylmuramyl pentapeptide phosphotransferase/UDP-N-acetylglucosamine-1-phosphate transferase
MPLSLGLSIAAFFITALLTWAWIKIAQTNKIHDHPEQRRLHLISTPRAGGISLAIVMIVTSMAILFQSNVDRFWVLIITTIASYSALGFWDDLKPLRSSTKLFFHLLVAVIIFLIAMLPLAMHLMASMLIAIAYLLFVNIWNFMDGSNGMVGMQSLLCTIGILALSHFDTATHAYALVLAASCLGFLPFNFPQARIFLGDVGSHLLGAAVLSLALLAYWDSQCTILELLCLASALWIDTVMTFVRRGLRGYKVMQAHRSHLYQYLIRVGQSHAEVCWYYAAWTSLVIFIIGFSRYLPESGQRIVMLAVIAIACVLHQCLRLFVLKSAHHPKNPKIRS